MAWEVVTNLMINGVNTTWTFSDIGRTKIISRDNNSVDASPSSLVNCDNPILKIPCKSSDSTVFDIDLGNGLHFSRGSNNTQRAVLNDVEIGQWSGQGNYNTNDAESILCFLKDDDTQTATICNMRGYYNTSWWRWYTSQNYYPNSNSGDLYNWIMGQAPVSYTWQSVPSISGKNGILSLVTLDSEAINDGEAVTGAAVSVFDQNPASGNNVKDIVDGNTPLIPSAVDVTATFIISNPPVGELASRILAAKKGSIPESIEDADKTVSIPANATSATMPGLDENSQYYFAIFVADATGDTAVSDPKDIYTSGDEGYNFDYTGEIVEWTVPKTGIYSLETWGAQGGDATDGTNSARGGYGAYAYGEVLLTQGEKLYINVGGQNGYGGGGNYVAPNNE